ncbi:MAG: hypothetical protein HY328_15595 [Chloroflexi bacterium]|nr:hypothetical protein [Chloroflexota bacterium]
MTNLLSKVLNGYRDADLGALTIEDLQRENLALNAKLSRMAATLAQNRLEVDKLRRSVRRQKPTYSWLAERAELDAKGLYTMQCAGLQPSRRQAKETLGMGERRWGWARALAMLAGVHDGDLFTDVDARTIITRLAEAAAYAELHPETWRTFRSR